MMIKEQMINSKPFLKWVGGKRSILPLLLARMPIEFTDYYEPFLGGGALFFASNPCAAHLSDINLFLIVTYQVVRDNVYELIKLLKIHAERHNKEYFIKARKQLAKSINPIEIAALFIYLNKTCFNGLYRVNKNGEFNVPIGSYKNPKIVDEETLRVDSELLKNATIEQKPFSQISIRKGAFYYLDPPYHGTYTGYDNNGFDDNEHIKLFDLCREIDKKGGYFMLSNSNTKFIKKLYKQYHIEEIQANRSVSCVADKRKKEYELIIRNYTRGVSE